MVSPAPVNPENAHRLAESAAALLSGAQNTSRFLRTFGFHVLAVLLGIALAFM
jgi:hypothetical protein